MAIAVDVSSPARVTAAGAVSSVITGSFDAPACLLLVLTCGDSPGGTGPAITVTNNGTALTWTLIGLRNVADSGGHGGVAAAHYAVLPAPRTGLTVTATSSVSDQLTTRVYCLTGADTAAPVGGSAEGSSTGVPPTNNLTTTGFTIARAGSLGFVAGNDFNANGAPTSADTTFDAYHVASQMSGGSGYKTLGAPGDSATFNLDAATTSGATWNWVSLEIKAASISVPAYQISQYGSFH